MNMVASIPLAQASGGQDPGLAPTFIMFGLMFVIIYFLIWRPQKQREDERQQMLSQLKKNDHVITNGGIHGIVTSIKDDEVSLRVDDAQNVRIRFARSAITAILSTADGGGAAAAADRDEKK